METTAMENPMKKELRRYRDYMEVYGGTEKKMETTIFFRVRTLQNKDSSFLANLRFALPMFCNSFACKDSAS